MNHGPDPIFKGSSWYNERKLYRRGRGNVLFKTLFRLIKLILLIAALAIGVNIFVVKSAEDAIVAEYNGEASSLSPEVIEKINALQPECILVLGASVNPDGTPSPMLQDRLDVGVVLYEKGVAPKILLSGDDGQVEYNEVSVMHDYVIEAGVPEADIFLDHAGFSTYDSVYRAGNIFGVERMVVVTQEYHLYRALYGCEAMNIIAVGVAAEQAVYAGQEARDIREVLARVKDCVKWLIKPESKYLGDAIPISGSGISTH